MKNKWGKSSKVRHNQQGDKMRKKGGFWRDRGQRTKKHRGECFKKRMETNIEGGQRNNQKNWLHTDWGENTGGRWINEYIKTFFKGIHSTKRGAKS